MPQAQVTHDSGSTPVITGSPARRILMLQNNSTGDFRYRIFGEVSLSDASKSGLVLKAEGGSVTLTGPAAQKAIYAVHGAGAGLIRVLDYDAEVQG